jgi:hypothetical protein
MKPTHPVIMQSLVIMQLVLIIRRGGVRCGPSWSVVVRRGAVRSGVVMAVSVTGVS